MKKLVPLFFTMLILAACQDDDTPEPILSVDCGEPIILADQTDVPASDVFDLIEVSVIGLCMDVTIGASGCSADGWAMKLRSSGEVAESIPTQTSARLIFDDGVEDGAACLAYFTVTYTFNLADYLNSGALPSNLILTGPDSEQTTVFFE